MKDTPIHNSQSTINSKNVLLQKKHFEQHTVVIKTTET